MPTTTTKKPEATIHEQIAAVDAQLADASARWAKQGSDPRLPIYHRTINGLLDRRARLMEKRDGRPLLKS